MSYLQDQLGSWYELLFPILNKENSAYKKYQKAVGARQAIYPNPFDLFRAFKLCPLEKTKVVILGQDPYHNGTADGLAFSSWSHKRPKSLTVIINEIYNNYFKNSVPWGVKKYQYFYASDLSQWSKQGVLLLNTSLTVLKGKPKSCHDWGWDEVVKKVIKTLAVSDQPVVFMLWGNDARKLKRYMKGTHVEILEASHPMVELYKKDPDTKAGFYECSHFTKTNWFLKKHKLLTINWGIYPELVSKYEMILIGPDEIGPERRMATEYMPVMLNVFLKKYLHAKGIMWLHGKTFSEVSDQIRNAVSRMEGEESDGVIVSKETAAHYLFAFFSYAEPFSFPTTIQIIRP